MGDVQDFRNFMNAVIDRRAFDKIAHFLEFARTTPHIKVLAGGTASAETGYFIRPTLLETQDPMGKTMVEEIFGPVATVFAYPDKDLEEAAALCEKTSPYGLTGAIFARDRHMIHKLTTLFRQAAGNFYINDKPTGAVVGQQPFGGSRASGTNDKAGSYLNLTRWLSPRTIKETRLPPTDYRYPFMQDQ